MFQRSNMEKKGAVLKPGSLQEEDLAVEEQKVLAEAKEAAKSAAAGKMIKHVWKSTVVSSASAWQDLWAKFCIQYQQRNRNTGQVIKRLELQFNEKFVFLEGNLSRRCIFAPGLTWQWWCRGTTLQLYCFRVWRGWWSRYDAWMPANWSKWMDFVRYTFVVFTLIQATDISSLQSSNDAQ